MTGTATPDRVLLLGMMAAGKTTVGRALAARLGWPYADNDDLVLAATGTSKEALVERSGEHALRAAESAALRLALDRPGPLVAGVAGGVVLDPANRALLREARGRALVVWLRVPLPLLARRLDSDRQDRPWLEGDTLSALQRLAADREPQYAALADLVVDCGDDPADSAAATIAAHLRPARVASP